MKTTKLNLGLLKILLNVNIMSGMIAFLSVVVMCLILNIAKNVFVPLMIAWFILQILRPVNRFGKKMHLHPTLNLIFVFLVLITVSVMGVRFIAAQAVNFNNVYNRYAPALTERYHKILELLDITPDTLSALNWSNIGFDFIRSSASYIAGSLIDITNKFFMTIFFLMFMLIEAPYTERKIDRAFKGKAGNRIKEVIRKISDQVSYYMINQTLLSAATAFCVWAILAVMKVELAGGLAFLAFLLNFIPNVGSIIATILPVLMSLIQFQTLFEPFIVLVMLTIVQMVIGNIIGPKVLSESLGVSSTIILLSLLFWSMIWGVPGAFLSVPIASIIKIVCENISPLKPIAVLMGN